MEGTAAIYSIQADKAERTLQVGEPVTDAIWTGTKVIFATSKGSVKVYDSGTEKASFRDHSGPVTGISLHPGGELVASVGADRSIVFYSLETLTRVARVYADAGMCLSLVLTFAAPEAC